MKTWASCAALMLLVLAMSTRSAPAQEPPTEPAVVGSQARRVVTNRIAVKARQVAGGGLMKSKLSAMGLVAAPAGTQAGPSAARDQLDGLGVSVVTVDPAQRVDKLNELARSPDVAFAAPIYRYEPQLVPNDPSYGGQYHHALIGNTSAWDATTGSNAIPIAILDTGVDANHPDLAGKVRTGFNFHDNNTNTSDTRGHGTATAGAAAAVGNNGTGVAGVAWNCPIIPCRISDSTGAAYSDTIAAAIKWAADNGARVINCSYGPLQGDTVIESAAQYARNKGVLVLVSSGNEGVRDSSAQSGSIMFVGATNSNDSIVSWSTTGPAVKIVAPGDRILTTQRGGGYANFSGTSFSSPIVAGAAALVMSANPNLYANEVEALLTATAKDLGATGRDESYGFGRLDVQAAVQAAVLSRTDPKAQLLSPSASTVLNSSSITFTWSAGVGVSATHLYVGTPSNSSAYFNLNMGQTRTATVNGIPLNGGPVRVWLYSLLGGTWQANIYDFTTATPQKAVLQNPAPGSTLSSSTTTFSWAAVSGAQAYWLYVGTPQNTSKYFSQVTGLNRTVSVGGIPMDGGTVRVWLYTQFGGSWYGNMYDLTASGAGTPTAKAVVTSPSPGSRLSGTSVTFQWSAGSGVSAYWIYVGIPGNSSKFLSSNVGQNRSVTVNGLPSDGSAVRVWLYSQINGSWLENVYDFSAFQAPPAARSEISSPTPGTALPSGRVEFSWPATGTAYWLYVGTDANPTAYFNQNLGNVTSVTVGNLPLNGSTVRTCLYTMVNGAWLPSVVYYTAAQARKAELTRPLVGALLSNSTQNFEWTAGVGATEYWLYVGTAANSSKYFNQQMGAALGATVNNLPRDGSEIRVWLYSKINGVWQESAYVFSSGVN